MPISCAAAEEPSRVPVRLKARESGGQVAFEKRLACDLTAYVFGPSGFC